MGSEAIFSHVTVLGTGLIGGSFALAVRQQIPEIGQILDTTDHAAGTNPYYSEH